MRLRPRPLIPCVLLLFFISIQCVLAYDLRRPWNNDSSNSDATTLTNHGIELLSKGHHASARRLFDAAVQADPGSYIVFYNRALYFRAMHQYELALKDLNTCLRLKRTCLDAYLMRAAINERLGNYKDALADYNGQVKVSTMPTWMLDCRASLLATCPDASVRDGHAAVADATAACRIDKWNLPQFIDTLAAAYAETGDFDSAVRFEEKAIARAHKLKWDSTGMEKRLALYQQRKPYRAPRSTPSRRQDKSDKLVSD